MKPHLVLVADYEPVVRNFLRTWLDRAGCSVRVVPSGSEALGIISTHEFDLVIVDVHMPDGNGLAVIREMKARGAKARILAISGGGGHLLGGDSLHLAISMGAHAVIAKPFTEEELKRALDLALRT